MNKTQRKELERAIDLISQANDILTSVRDEEQEKFDNLPEGFQTGARGEAMENGISSLDDIASETENLSDTIREVMEA